MLIQLFLIAILSVVTKGQTCKTQENSDIVSGEALQAVSNTRLDQCCGICADTPNCKAFAFNDFQGGTCSLKSVVEPVIFKEGVTVGIFESSDPGPGPNPSDGPFTGDATFYDITAGLTACGTLHGDNDLVVAMAPNRWTAANPNLDPLCAKFVLITNPATGISIRCQVQDKCPGCENDDLDLTRGVFTGLGEDLSKGRFQIVWSFVD